MWGTPLLTHSIAICQSQADVGPCRTADELVIGRPWFCPAVHIVPWLSRIIDLQDIRTNRPGCTSRYSANVRFRSWTREKMDKNHANMAILIGKMMTYTWIYGYTIFGQNLSPWVGTDLESQELRSGYSQPPCPENSCAARSRHRQIDGTNRNIFSLTEPQFSGILIRLMR